MNNWELVALSINEGTKLREVDDKDGCYSYFDKESQQWLDQDGDEVDCPMSSDCTFVYRLEIYQDRKTVTHYAAFYRNKCEKNHQICASNFWPTKAELMVDLADFDVVEFMERDFRV
jgi:hypothetical protein